MTRFEKLCGIAIYVLFVLIFTFDAWTRYQLRQLDADMQAMRAELVGLAAALDKPVPVVMAHEVRYIAPPPEPIDPEPELKYLGEFTAYAYCPCKSCCGKPPDHPAYGITASGTTATRGRTVAADPAVIPLGTEIFIGGMGFRTVEDTGSGIDGMTLDIYMDSHTEALNFGVQTVKVWEVTD